MKTTWLKTFALALSFAGLQGTALAQDIPAAGTVSVGAIDYNGNGCGPNSVAMNISPDAQAFTLLFDSYVADSTSASARSGPQQVVDEKGCQLNIQLKFPAGWSFSLLGLQVRGFAQLDAQSIGQHSLAFRVPGLMQERQFENVTLRGPYSADYMGQTTFDVSNLSWTPCTGTTQSVFLRTRLTANSQPGGQALLTVDSIDGELEQMYGIAWRHCDDNVGNPAVQRRLIDQLTKFKNRRDRPTIGPRPGGPRPGQPNGLPNLNGNWADNRGYLGTIVANGTALTMTNNGSTSTGTLLSPSLMNGWGITAAISADAKTITWANGAIWTRGFAPPPSILGSWQDNRGFVAVVTQSSPSNPLMTLSENGSVATGIFTGPRTIASNWGISGALSADANTITWSNGVIWTRGVAPPANLSGTYQDSRGYVATIVQTSPTQMTMSMNGSTTVGTYIPGTSMLSTNWGAAIVSSESGRTVITWTAVGATWRK